MSMHLKFCIVSVALVAAFSVGASSVGARYDKNDPQCMSGGIAEDRSPLPMESTYAQNYNVKSEAGLLRDQNEALRSTNESLKSENQVLHSDNNNLRSENGRLKSRWLWPWIFLSFVVGGVCGLVLYRVARRTPGPNVAIPTRLDTGLPKCPRCGLEHNPDDTVCKNPKCRTQF